MRSSRSSAITASSRVIPEEYGGIALSCTQYLPLLAEFSKVSGVVRVLLHVHNTSARAIVAYGTEAQKKALLPALATGEQSLTFAITEPNSGSGMDVGTQARREGDHWIVNGAKHYITNADFATGHLILLPHRRSGRPPRAHRAGSAHRRGPASPSSPCPT